MDILNMLSRVDIYQFPYDDIKTLFRNHSRVSMKKGRSSQSLVNSSPSTKSIKHETRNMLEDFMSEMLQAFALQMDTMKIKRKKEEAEITLAIFFPRCTKRNPRN